MSSITFNHIVLNNFMSYEHEEFDLDRNGYIFVSGVNNNELDNAKSNGSGKSSLFSAICWCLTGETPSGNKKVENIYLEGKTYVELIFEINGHEYIINRSKNPSNLKIIIDGEDKSGKGIRDGEKLLAEYLPDITANLINSVIILGQGLPKRFTNNTPSGRKEVLEKLSNSDFMINDIKDRISTRFNKLNSDKEEYNRELILKITKRDLLKSEIVDNQIKLNEINVAEMEEELSERREFLTALQEDLDSFISAKEEVDFQINENTIKLNRLSEDLNIEINNLEDVPQEYYQEFGSLSSEMNNKRQEIDKLQAVTDICPTCGQKIPGVSKIDTEPLEKEYKEITNKFFEISEKIKQGENKYREEKTKLVTKYGERKNEINNIIATLKYDSNNYSSYINDKTFQLKEISDKVIDLEVQINSINSIKENLENSIKSNKEEVETLDKEISSLEEFTEKVQERLDIISKINTLIKRDFRGYLLSNIILFISDKVKTYSKEVFGSDCFSFELNDNNIDISFDNKDYESLSGGEKQKADIIIQLAIRDMLCNYLNFSSNILVLDEITDSLDIIGSQNILNLISKELTDVEAIYIISHHSDFSIPWDEEIIVAKDNDKISRII